MKKIILLILSLFVAANAAAVDMASIVKAQVVLGQIDQVMQKYEEVQALLDNGTVELEVQDPIADNTGKFVLPFDEAGNPTEWAAKALTAKAGAELGGMAGEKAAGALAAKVPFAGGFMAGAAKKKSKEMGAVMAIGGWDFIKENSSQSFNSMYDYSVYMHSQFNGLPGYEEALAAAMAIYPGLEKSHKRSVDKAYKDAKKEARRIAKEAKKRQKEAKKNS